MDPLHERDRRLIQIVDAAMAEAMRRGGSLVQCRLGCTECCEGPFEINSLDAFRLRRGLQSLRAADPAAAISIVERARNFAGGDSDPCPVLDRATGACLLYEYRPMICRTFGPAVSSGPGAVAVCHLNYVESDPRELLAIAIDPDPEGLEAALLAALDAAQSDGDFTIAAALSAV